MGMDRWSQRVRVNPWIVVPCGVGLVVGVAIGWPIGAAVALAVYAAGNAYGVSMYCEQLRSRRPRLQLVLRALAVVLVPVGVVTALLTPGGMTPSESSTAGSPDDRVQRASSFAPVGVAGRGDGGGAA